MECVEPEHGEGLLTPAQEQQVETILSGPPSEVLVGRFGLKVTRSDLRTLAGANWLNDTIINFYVNLLAERSEHEGESHGYPKVYAMNTFFVPRLLQGGHAGVSRWTRKVDIFSKDVILVPVHVGDVHWAMAVVDWKNCTLRYYDSLGVPNPTVLTALEQYLQEESMVKRKQTLDTSKFAIESVKDIPRQRNLSDCGVFSCMYAEYITRNKGVDFHPEEAREFRKKMTLEILEAKIMDLGSSVDAAAVPEEARVRVDEQAPTQKFPPHGALNPEEYSPMIAAVLATARATMVGRRIRIIRRIHGRRCQFQIYRRREVVRILPEDDP